jgi:putative transposase
MAAKTKSQEDLFLDSLLADYKKPEDFLGENGILKRLTKAVIERALQAEMTAHLGHDKNESVVNAEGNTRNGYSSHPFQGHLSPAEQCQ